MDRATHLGWEEVMGISQESTWGVFLFGCLALHVEKILNLETRSSPSPSGIKVTVFIVNVTFYSCSYISYLWSKWLPKMILH
jgi:hypothetical protein